MKCFVNDIAGIIKTPADDREYEQMIKGNIRWLYFLLVFGACALAVCLANEFWHFTKADSFIDGVYSGVGFSFMLISAMNIRKFKKLLKDQKKLHQQRIEKFDERRIEISRQAVVTAFVIFCFLLFAAMLIIGYFNRIVFWCCWVSFMLYMIIFSITYAVYSKKM